MTMPHKTCPHCGQPAVAAMQQCRRCGYVYAPPVGPFSPPAAQAVETPRAHQATRQVSRSAAPLLLLLALGLGVLLIGAAVREWKHTAAASQVAFSGEGLPGGPAVNAFPTDAASSPGKLSLFVESESKQERPVLTFRNFADGALTLTLRDRFGHAYRAVSREAQEATLQVPAGEYSVSIDSDSPRIRPNWGDAAFRKFKSYHADFVAGHSDTRIHLGE